MINKMSVCKKIQKLLPEWQTNLDFAAAADGGGDRQNSYVWRTDL